MSICLFMFYLQKRLIQPAQKSECQQFWLDSFLSLFLFSLFLFVSFTLSPYVVLCISQMNQTGYGVK